MGLFVFMTLSDLLKANHQEHGQKHRGTRWIIALLSPISVLVLWQVLIWVNQLPPYILPSPLRVWTRFVIVLNDGSLLHHTLITLGETLGGLALGLSVAAVLGYVLAHSPILEKFLEPYIVASQSVPIVAIAPLLIIWFGSGLTSKILICALIVFFPALINTIVGVRSVEQDLSDLMRSLRANRWQTFVHLELPSALPMVLSGIKIGATLAVIGAVIGEFVSADRGLGFLITSARNNFDTALVFVAILALVVIAIALYGTVAVMEKILLKWKQ